MGFETLRYEVDGAVATIAFDCGKVNAMTTTLHREFFEVLTDFLRNDAIKVGILTSADGKPFSVGEDIKTPRPKEDAATKVARHLNPHGQAELGRPGWDADVMALERYKPIIGAVRGWCLGQGMLYLMQHTDIRIASETARLGFPEINFGMAGAGGWIRLSRQIAHVHAMELLLTGDKIDAGEAARIGLVNRVVPDAALETAAREMADKIARHPALGIRVEMESYYRAQDMTREQALGYATNLYRLQRVAAGDDDLPSQLG